MAILDSVPGIKVTVQIGGQDVVEYDDPDASEIDASRPISSKYIECIDGAEFTIRCKARHQYVWGHRGHCLEFQARADDVHLIGVLVCSNIQGHSGTISGRYERGERDGLAVEQKCRFAAISTVDDSRKERVKRDMAAARHLGMIEVKVYRSVYKGNRPRTFSSPSASKPLEFTEKSLKGKAISHGVSLASGESIKAPSSAIVSRLIEDDGPIATFRFHYRSRESLKREMIIPRSPSASPSLSNMSRTELERLARERLDQLREKEEAKEKVKEERQSRIKRESRSAVKREAGEVFDLTQDNVPRRKRLARSEVIDLTDD